MLHPMREGMHSRLIEMVNDYLVGKRGLVGIEIGSYAGESAEMFINSGAFDKLYCIDPWEMYTAAPNDATGDEGIYEAEKAFDRRFCQNPLVVKLKMKSADTIQLFEDDSIDFIYIDGVHQYDAVKQDLQLYVPKIKKGGIISGHDWHPNWPGVVKAVKEFFGKEPLSIYGDGGSWVYIKG